MFKHKKEQMDDEFAEVEVEGVLSLDDFVNGFVKRYKTEKSFKETVHTYMHLNPLKKFSLTISKVIPSWYEKRTDDLITEYARKARSDLVREMKNLHNDMDELGSLDKTVHLKQQTIQNQTQAYTQSQKDLEAAQKKSGAERAEIEKKINGDKSELESKVAEQKQKIIAKTDATIIVKDHLRKYIEASQFIQNDGGSINFDNQKMAEILEDTFLGEIINEIEDDDGFGFMTKLKTRYEGLIDHWGSLTSLNELPHVNWIKSSIYSRTKGYRLPTFPYLITGKTGNQEKNARASIDTAIVVDRSGSMDENQRWEIAQKTTLALHSLMRKLNPKNNTYLACYDNVITPATTAQMMRELRPNGGTETDRALYWMRDVLKDSGPSIGYLLTDGAPNSTSAAIEAAKEFRNTQIMLNIFLIDGNYDTESITREIGKAAGDRTRVIPVTNYQLATGAIKNIDEVIREMYTINDF